MMKAHGVCYEVYRRNHRVRMKVEQRREREHQKYQQILTELDRKLHINYIEKRANGFTF